VLSLPTVRLVFLMVVILEEDQQVVMARKAEPDQSPVESEPDLSLSQVEAERDLSLSQVEAERDLSLSQVEAERDLSLSQVEAERDLSLSQVDTEQDLSQSPVAEQEQSLAVTANVTIPSLNPLRSSVTWIVRLDPFVCQLLKDQLVFQSHLSPVQEKGVIAMAASILEDLLL